MRTTITLSDDVAAAVEKLRRDRGIGLSEAVNALVRSGLRTDRPPPRFVQTEHDLGAGVDVSNIAEVLETLDGPAGR